jgi:hypothetical protein
MSAIKWLVDSDIILNIWLSNARGLTDAEKAANGEKALRDFFAKHPSMLTDQVYKEMANKPQYPKDAKRQSDLPKQRVNPPV